MYKNREFIKKNKERVGDKIANRKNIEGRKYYRRWEKI